eukprot:NODE_27214_length_521_cov_3.281726.p2 GENE.NODE_27214_length_521_cov_3.281726~~NODE_27214_length_521_cov_3.281726.p2  ORF type:complete len:63 (+),score=7.71 NODE_27214_length_521_cov_3.281726:227-415(+)
MPAETVGDDSPNRLDLPSVKFQDPRQVYTMTMLCDHTSWRLQPDDDGMPDASVSLAASSTVP